MMYKLYQVLKDKQAHQEHPTTLKLDLAGGRCTHTDAAGIAYFQKLAANQEAKARAQKVCSLSSQFVYIRYNIQEPSNHKKWERLLVDWIMLSNQPFTVVNDLRFNELLEYTHHGNESLNVSIARSAAKQRTGVQPSKHGASACSCSFLFLCHLPHLVAGH
jgi:hypothetical protein